MTNEEINALTDPQINVMMTISVHGAHGYKPNERMSAIYKISSHSTGGVDVASVKDYCNDHAVMMPIVFDQKINLISPTYDLWMASWTDGGGKWSVDDYKHHDTNPLRAAAIVYLKMKGVL